MHVYKETKTAPKRTGQIDAGSANLYKYGENRAENRVAPQIPTNKQRLRICCLYTAPPKVCFETKSKE